VRFAHIVSVAALPGRSFLLVDDAQGFPGLNAVRRVDADGIVHTVADSRALKGPRDVATTADGSVIVADLGADRVVRIGPDGRVSTIAGKRGRAPGPPGRADGQRATEYHLSPVSVAELPGDGLLVATGSTVDLVTTGDSTQSVLGVGMPHDGVRSFASRLSVKVRTSAPARVRLEVRRARRVVAAVTRRLSRAGSNRFVLRRRFAPGLYAVRVTGTSTRGGSRAEDAHRLALGGRLEFPAARLAMRMLHLVGQFSDDDDGTEYELRARLCRRVRGRVDCRVDISREQSKFACDHVESLRLRGDGQLMSARYRCGRPVFRPFPHWEFGWALRPLPRP
jgi:hypothetical protein